MEVLVFLMVYLACLVVSFYRIEGRKTFTRRQKRWHLAIAVFLPFWGILIHAFKEGPEKGSHFYSKTNKYSGNTEYDEYNTDAQLMNGDDSHYESH